MKLFCLKFRRVVRFTNGVHLEPATGPASSGPASSGRQDRGHDFPPTLSCRHDTAAICYTCSYTVQLRGDGVDAYLN